MKNCQIISRTDSTFSNCQILSQDGVNAGTHFTSTLSIRMSTLEWNPTASYAVLSKLFVMGL